MPATTHQWPNWSIPLPEPIETLKSNQLAASIGARVGQTDEEASALTTSVVEASLAP